MAMIRATFIFEDTNKHGWSETIHTTKPDLTSAMTAALALVDKRRNLLGTSARISYVRVSDDDVFRDSLVRVISAEDGSTRSSGDFAAEPANTSFVTRLQALPTVRRTLFMRGIPDGIVINSGRFSGDPAWRAAFAVWAGQLTADGWACRTKDRLIVPVNITAMAQDVVTGQVTFTTDAPHGLTINRGVIIKGSRGPLQINGRFPVLRIGDATHFTVIIDVILGAYFGGAVASKVGYQLDNITEVQPVRISDRKAGRPFDSPRGRRKKARRT